MLDILARQSWRYPLKMWSSLFRRLISSSAGALVREQQTSSKTRSVTSQENTKNFYHLRGWLSVIDHHYKDVTNYYEAKAFLYSFPKIKTVLKPQLNETLSILKCQGYSWEEVKEYREILLLSPSHLTHRLKILQDFSIHKPTLHQVIYVSEFMQCNISILRDNGVYSQNYNIFHQLLAGVRNLEFPNHVVDQFLIEYRDDDSTPLKELYLYFLKHYLAQRFSRDVDEVESLFEKGKFPSWKPLSAYVDICDVIINSYGPDFSTVLANPVLLDLDPEKVKQLVERFPYIGKVSTVDAIKAFPDLILLPHLKIERWLTLLRKYKVTEFIVDEYTIRLFKSNAFRDVDRRLQALKELPEWEVIRVYEKLFDILRDPSSVKKLLNAAEDGPVMSIASVIEGSGMKLRVRRVTPELTLYVAKELAIEKHEAREILQEDLYIQYGMANNKMVLQLLFDFGFTREQIINGIVVLNFEYGIVDQGLREFPSRAEAQPFHEWMENPFVLHLLVYCIKKDVPHLELPVKG